MKKIGEWDEDQRVLTRNFSPKIEDFSEEAQNKIAEGKIDFINEFEDRPEERQKKQWKVLNISVQRCLTSDKTMVSHQNTHTHIHTHNHCANKYKIFFCFCLLLASFVFVAFGVFPAKML